MVGRTTDVAISPRLSFRRICSLHDWNCTPFCPYPPLERYYEGKLKTAVVQCSAADVNRLIDGVLGRMNREIGEHVVVKSGQADINDVVSKFEGCSGKRKQLLVIEQAESLSTQFLNGLFYSLPSFRCDVIVLLCVSTKQNMFTSRVSRRCLASLHARRFLFSLSPEVFYSLVTSVLFNPSFTDLRLQAGFLRFIRLVSSL
ncbi:hypothetical protein Y032_0003g1247 [Ancylostoma ceylanicum]|uniref:Uncharacterized protein n=1 Tax=Ancylostoma ceylanicum TaxID=53326 RepID=A0A016VW11_9BILA|nr:hypothetical protein Y032_0003g1247 [Ancylostoma ceylanicum]